MKRKKGSIAATYLSTNSTILRKVLYILFLAVMTGSSCNPKTESATATGNDIGGVVTGSNGPEAGGEMASHPILKIKRSF
jgi:hypothetical protein